MKFFICIFIPFIFLPACQPEDIAIPKPRIFPRVHFPIKAYDNFIAEDCHFSFEKPAYVRVEKDTAFFDGKPVDPCWFDLFYPNFDARLHFSYYPIGVYKDYEQLRQDAFTLAQKHNIKANYIDELPLKKSEDIQGMFFQMEGAAASPVQFYLTDKQNHFLRGSLYFNTQARPDSLAPIIDFIKDDIGHLVNTFTWD